MESFNDVEDDDGQKQEKLNLFIKSGTKIKFMELYVKEGREKYFKKT